MLVLGMVGIVEVNVEWIIKDSLGFFECDIVFGQVGCSLSFGPFKSHKSKQGLTILCLHSAQPENTFARCVPQMLSRYAASPWIDISSPAVSPASSTFTAVIRSMIQSIT